MKTKRDLLKSVRMFIIGVMAVASTILMLGEPANEESWFRIFLISKVSAIIIGFACIALLSYWESKGLLPDDEKEK